MWSTNRDVFCNQNYQTGVPLNTLQYKCIQQVANTAAGLVNEENSNHNNKYLNDLDLWLDKLAANKEDFCNLNDDEEEDGSYHKTLDNSSIKQQTIQSLFEQLNQSKSDIRSASSSSLASSLSSTQSLTETCSLSCCIPFDLRQQLHDHAVREQVALNADFLCQILSDGGLRRLDFWSLCDIGNFSKSQIRQILHCITENGYNLHELTLGGESWMFDSKILSTHFRQLLCNGNLQQLRQIRLQLVTKETADLIGLLSCCPKLQKLEIAQPSITDEQLFQLSEKSNLKNLIIQELYLPSSVTGPGLASAIRWLPKLEALHCAHFEHLIDYTNEINDENEQLKLKSALHSLHTLQISLPLSADLPACISKLCPNLKRLRLETQELMQLQPLYNLQYLQVLHLHNSNSFGSSYLTDILPLLREIGHQLVELNLEQFDVIDLNELGTLCPNLQALSIQWFSILGIGRTNRFGAPWAVLPEAAIERDPTILFELPERLKHRNHFKNLRFLRLHPHVHRPLPVHLIEFMVCNSRVLQYLELYGLQQASEQYWNRIMTCSCNGWNRLKYLIIRQGTEISFNCIDQLLRTTDQLTYLECKKPFLSKTDLTSN